MWKFIAIIVHITAGHKNHIYLCICIRARVSSNPFRLLALVHFTIISIIILIEGRRWIEHQSLHSCKEGSIEQGKMTRCKRKWKCNLVQVLLFLSFSTSLSLLQIYSQCTQRRSIYYVGLLIQPTNGETVREKCVCERKSRTFTLHTCCSQLNRSHATTSILS